MKKIKKLIYRNALFLKIFLVMILSIGTVALLITFSNIRMSSQLFIDTFSMTNTKSIRHISAQLTSFSDSLLLASKEVETNPVIKQYLHNNPSSAVEKSQAFYHIQQEIEQIHAILEPRETNIVLLANYLDTFTTNYVNWDVAGEELLQHELTNRAQANKHDITYQFESSEITNHIPMFIASKALRYQQNNNVFGYLFLSIRENDLRSLYEGYTSEGNDILLMDATGTIFSSSKGELLGQHATSLLHHVQADQDELSGYSDVNVLGQNYLCFAEYIPSLDIYLVNLIDHELITSNLINTREILFISATITLIALIFSFLTLRKMTVSISNIVHNISDMARYQFTRALPVKGGYESKKIAIAFNYMLNELQDYVNILLNTQEKQRKAELTALQHQINPHFIYNTLTSIKFMIKQKQNDKALTTMDSFISMLQASLNTVDQTTTVAEEVETLRHYVQINHARYGEQIQVNFLVSPDCLSLQIPKLIIQPFIENAFFHAFVDKKQGFIKILIAQKQDMLVCEVIDNGDGMEQTRDFAHLKNKKQLFSGIGIKNVHERIQLLYGNKYGVTVTSEPQQGTNVTIKLPILA
ncbi:sensor histidine kinase [Gracilibacillus alcaliphilus]|uniref:sensor histidine kinase n=1 Tax=Gracilibacillus alcaliphilus TaxID=1401441 RepID=UPI00195C5779|nr:sensor histidine kinase [Gracilibacillus alcaliphilus]MBM7679055.1 two-component system sensor histidine kinase YesM [Gracilibacillus alcaliphilus]